MCFSSDMRPTCTAPSKMDQADQASNSEQPQKISRQKSPKKRKPKRVLYPAQVRKYLPRQEKDKAKKWLLILGAIVFLQIFLEDDGQCDHEIHKTLVAHDSNGIKFPDYAHTTNDSRPLLTGQGPEVMALGNSTILYFITGSQGTWDSILSRSMYYDSRNDTA